jgi:D-alanine--poly(phosphoribitol) ligase subunit 1
MLLKSSLIQIANSKQNLEKEAYSNQGNVFKYEQVFSSAEYVRVYLASEKISTPVIVYGHKQVGMFSSFIGCNSAGVAFVPVDVSTPLERVENIIKLSGAEVIIAVSPLPFKVHCRVVDFASLIKIPILPLNLNSFISGESLSYIIFTSGSTGLPKGVEISIEALDDFVEWSQSLIDDTKEFVFVNQALFSFDLSVFELWTSIVKQGKIVALEHKNNNNIRAHFEMIQKESCTIWVSTPSFADLCLIDKKFAESNMHSLRYFVFCGEILSKSTVVKLKERFPKSHILNLYGPTEATCAMTAIEITNDILLKYDVLPVGFVKPKTKMYIDDNGEGNELIIVGKNVSHGYINDPKKTAKQFFTKDGQRAYRTGDYGYFDDKGLLFVKGRIDRQIKFKGYRIELEEIEAVIRTTLNVSNALCSTVVKDGKVTELIGVLQGNDDISFSEFSDKLRFYLPDYMIPSKLKFIKVMPLSKNGKIDRNEVEKLINTKE